MINAVKPQDTMAKKKSQATLPALPVEFNVAYRRNVNRKANLIPMNSRHLYQLDHVIVYIIYCEVHKNIVLCNHPNGVWFPFVSFSSFNFFMKQVEGGARAIFGNSSTIQFNHFRMVHKLRVQHPINFKFLNRYIFSTVVTMLKQDTCVCATKSDSFSWNKISNLVTSPYDLHWGPEPVTFAQILDNDFKDPYEFFFEFSSVEELPKAVPALVSDIPDVVEKLLITHEKIEAMYYDFLQHCWPTFALTYDSFRKYLSTYSISHKDPRMTRLFRAFDTNSDGLVTFTELLLGMINLEPLTFNINERIAFIFRYYGKDPWGPQELKLFLNEATNLDNKLKLGLKTWLDKVEGEFKGKNSLSARAFEAICLKIPASSSCPLVRSNNLIINQFSNGCNIMHNKVFSQDWISKILVRFDQKSRCEDCSKGHFDLLSHVVQVDPDTRRFIRCEPIRNITRAHSFFKKDFWCNVILKDIREFNPKKGLHNSAKGIYQSKPQHMQMLVTKFKELIIPLFRKQNICVPVEGPAYIIGDIHGNIEDLLSLESALWGEPPFFGPKLLVLGDIVDRGKWSLECIMYLMSLKIMEPDHVFILRGNHETRDVQIRYTFKKECTDKYGNDYGSNIWKMMNEIFDHMPLAAVLDKSIFCCHGGLSPGFQSIHKLNNIEMPLPEPRSVAAALDVLWSDPVSLDRLLDSMQFQMVLDEHLEHGFVPSKRGAGYYFNGLAVYEFLEANGLQNVVRAHVAPMNGTEHFFLKKCSTVFSCSHYLGENNTCAVVFVDSSTGKMRELKIDTSGNKPAMDALETVLQ